jgi:hypothetical protein
MDIDPVATFIAQVKTTPIDPQLLEQTMQGLMEILHPMERRENEYQRRLRPEDDISVSRFRREREGFDIPSLRNLQHWFRRYVIIDLARIRHAIEANIGDDPVRQFFLAVFASTIRPVSNADPVPVSGLEYTKVMREKDEEGRYLNAFAVFEEKANSAIAAMTQFYGARAGRGLATTFRGNALHLASELEQHALGIRPTLILTSPPYLTAVEYHRRHTLEAFWLRLTENDGTYLAIYHDYIGRQRVRIRDAARQGSIDVPRINAQLMELKGQPQEGAIRTYFKSMQRVLAQLAAVLQPGGHAVIAVSDSTSGERLQIETQQFFRSYAKFHGFVLEHAFCYEIRNRYMQYTRHNHADIDREWLLAFRRI